MSDLVVPLKRDLFLPTNLLAVDLWLDAADKGSITKDGSNKVSQWTDKSGKKNHAIQETGVNQPTWTENQLNGNAIMSFGGNHAMTLPSALYSIPAKNNTVFAVCFTNSDNTQQRIINMTAAFSTKFSLQYTSGVGSITYVSTTNSTGIGASTIIETNWNIVKGRRIGNTHAISTNGRAEITNFLASDENAINEASIGAYTTTSQFLDGGIAEIIVFSRDLSAFEYLQVELYLADKWGIYHPLATWINRYDPPVQAAIHHGKLNKSDIDNNPLLCWIDSNDVTTITKDGSNRVSQINDKSGKDNHALQAITTNQPTYASGILNNRSVLSFNGTNFLTLPSGVYALANGNNTIFIVSKLDSVEFLERLISMSISGSTKLLLSYSPSGNASYYNNLSFDSTSITVPEPLNFNTITAYKDGPTQSIAINGDVAATDTAGLNVSGINEAAIGAHPSGADALNGDIAEIIIYDVVLEAKEQEIVGIYLADKWALYHPKALWIKEYSIPEQIAIHAGKLNKSQIDSATTLIALWLDISEPDTVTKDTNQRVQQLNDKGASGNNALQGTTTSQPVFIENGLNQLPLLDFDGNDFLNVGQPENLNFIPQTDEYTVLLVANVDVGNWGTFISKGNNTESNRSYQFAIDSGFHLLSIVGGEVQPYSSLDPSVGKPNIFSLNVSTSQQEGFRGGISGGSDVVGSSTSTFDVLIGARRGGDNTTIGFPLTGQIAEMLVYRASLASLLQQQAEVYLADKWALYHPEAIWIKQLPAPIQGAVHARKLNKSQAETTDSSLIFWYDASDTDTITIQGINDVSQWDDRSPHKNHALQGLTTRQPVYNASGLNGKPTLTFAQDYFIAQSQVAIGKVTVIAVFTNDNTFPIGGSDVDFIISHSGFNVSTANGFIDVSEPEWRQENLGAVSYFLDGEQQAGNNTPLTTGTTYIGSIISESNTTEDSVVGIAGHRNDSGFASYFGNISEIIVINDAVELHVLELIEVYLADKWEVYHHSAAWINQFSIPFQAAIHSQKLNRSSAENTDNPILLWYDADDTDTLTVDENRKVSQITDKSPHGNNATQGTLLNQPTLQLSSLNGKNTIEANDIHSMVFPHLADMNLEATVFAVVKSDQDNSANTFGNFIHVNGVAPNAERQPLIYFWRDNASREVSVSAGSLDALFYTESDNIQNGKFACVTYQTDSSTMHSWLFGENEKSASHSFSQTGGSGHLFGSSKGNLAELIILNKKIPDEQRSSIELYLANKWGLYHADAEWITEFTTVEQAAIHAGKLNKDQVDDTPNPLVLWLDSNSFPSITKDGSDKVSQWNDRGPYAHNATQGVSLDQPTWNDDILFLKDAIHLDGTDDSLILPTALRSYITRTTDHTMFFVFKADDTSSSVGNTILNASQANDDMVGLQIRNNVLTVGYYNGSSYQKVSGVFSDTSNPHIISVTHANDAQPQMWLDGVEQSGTDQPAVNVEPGSRIGRQIQDNMKNYEGLIAEVIIFSSVLSDSLRQNIESYLTTKWGI